MNFKFLKLGNKQVPFVEVDKNIARKRLVLSKILGVLQCTLDPEATPAQRQLFAKHDINIYTDEQVNLIYTGLKKIYPNK